MAASYTHKYSMSLNDFVVTAKPDGYVRILHDHEDITAETKLYFEKVKTALIAYLQLLEYTNQPLTAEEETELRFMLEVLITAKNNSQK